MKRATRIGMLIALLVIGLGTAAVPRPAAAQGRDDLEDRLRATDELLARAREVVLESESVRARDLLENAERVQRNAWEQFRDGRPVFASKLTLEARELAARATTVAREDFSLQNRARLELERAQKALQQAREAYDLAPGDQFRRLLEEAAAQIERGRVQLHEQHYEAALRLALFAQRLIKEAIGSESEIGSERVHRELERTDQLIERVESIVRESEIEEAGRLLAHATDLQSSAWEALREGSLRRAYAVTREARGLASRAATLARGPVDAEGIGRALEEADRALDRATEIVRSSKSENAERILESAREHRVRAERLLDDGQARAALAEIRVTRSLAKRAIDLAQDEGA